MNPTQLDTLLENREDYNLEFKEAKRRFSLKELHDYCAAISNETGGHLLIGVKMIVQSLAQKNLIVRGTPLHTPSVSIYILGLRFMRFYTRTGEYLCLIFHGTLQGVL